MRKDVNQIAASIVAQTTQNEPTVLPDGRNAAAVALGSLGGKKGGPARAASLSKKRLKEIATKAAQARWSKNLSKT